jgi:hypothetical protein
MLRLSHPPAETVDKTAVGGHDADAAGESYAHRLVRGAKLDPDEYLNARKQLKRAVSEHYHALEVLNNYRVRLVLSCWPPVDNNEEADSEYYRFSESAQEVRKDNRGMMMIRFH